ncbi:MAG: hypothetical protein L3J79_11050, partial [Candidatus Marinimicrobia bacterium]|nr:hypothetical protein [Candidatus Neomarinimicrobiota bacterium]
VVKTGSRTNSFREASEGNTQRLKESTLLTGTSRPYRVDMFDEQAKRSLTHWEGVKYFEIFHVGELEDDLARIIGDSEINTRGWGSNASTVFNNAPHKTARNTRYWEGRTDDYNTGDPTELDADDQRPVVGVYTSAVWYHLEAILNPGNKQPVSVSGTVDWAYNYSHLNLLAEYSGRPQAMLYATTLMKNWQVRDITQGNEAKATIKGWGLRTCTPYLAYSMHGGVTDTMANLDEYSTGLYKRFLQRSLEVWLEVVKDGDFAYTFPADLSEWPRGANTPTVGWSKLPYPGYKPSEWNGGRYMFDTRNLADNFWRLLPLLDQVGVDRDVLLDLVEWCQAAWPGPGGTNDWNGRIANLGNLTNVKKNRLYRFRNMAYNTRYINAAGGVGSLVGTSTTADTRASWWVRTAAGQWMYFNRRRGGESLRLFDRPNSARLNIVSSSSESGSNVMWRALSVGDGQVRLQGKDGSMKFIHAGASGILLHGNFGSSSTSNKGDWKLVNPWANQ